MDRRSAVRGLASLTVTGVAGCVSALTARDGTYDIGMSAMTFEPERHAIEPGETVVWKNTSSRAHTVTAYDDGIPDDAPYFASGEYEREADAREAWTANNGGILHSGETYRHTFELPGSYRYVCIPHERGGMIGEIVVSTS